MSAYMKCPNDNLVNGLYHSTVLSALVRPISNPSFRVQIDSSFQQKPLSIVKSKDRTLDECHYVLFMQYSYLVNRFIETIVLQSTTVR